MVLLIRLFVVLIGSLDHCHGCRCLLLIHLPDDLVEASLRVRAEVRSSSGRCGIQGVVLLLGATHVAGDLHRLCHVEVEARLPNLLPHALGLPQAAAPTTSTLSPTVSTTTPTSIVVVHHFGKVLCLIQF